VTIPFAAAPDLTGPSRFVAPRDFIWDDNLPVDLDGHGTHVAGTIGQLTNNGVGVAGMAFNVRLMPVKVIGGDWDFIFGAPNEATTSVVAAGIRYAADNGAQVINMSLGFDGPGPLPAIEEALRYAVGKGAFVTVSAGNGLRGRQPRGGAGRDRREDGRRDLGRRGRPQSRPGLLFELALVGRDRRAGRRLPVRRRAGRRRPADLRPGRVGVDPLSTRWRSTTRRATTSSATRPTRAPRWRPARRRPGRAAHPAGHHQAGGDRGAIKRFATDRGAAGRDDDFGFGLISPRETLRGLGLTR
jgi:serine protease